MNVFNLKEIERCFVCGNVDRNMDRFINSITSNLSKFEKEAHPKEIERQKRLEERRNNPLNHQAMEMGEPGRFMTTNRNDSNRKMKLIASMKWGMTNYDNSIIIVSGNGGIGLKSKRYYDETFSKLEKVLADNNCYIFFIRGNSDDPSYFENRLIDFDHIKTIPDYSVIVLKTFNCLCIGGSTSMDKEWKLSQEELFGKKRFWENEAPIVDEKQLDEILAEFKISCVVSSTSPSFVYPSANSFKNSKWFSNNKEIMRNFTNERRVMDKVYEKILDSDSKPFVWAYGRFKMNHNDKTNDIVFLSLGQYQIISTNDIITSMFGIDTSKKLKANDYAFESLISTYYGDTKCEPHDPYDHEEDEMLDDLDVNEEREEEEAEGDEMVEVGQFEMPQDNTVRAADLEGEAAPRDIHRIWYDNFQQVNNEIFEYNLRDAVGTASAYLNTVRRN